MTDRPPEIRMIPVNAITVLNPRDRNKRVFKELVESIAHLGLKKPITVSRRKDAPGFDLVCGQGRLEAFVALGQVEIPAIVLDVTEEDCFIMSLVENLARRQHGSLELVREIAALNDRGYSYAQIGAKLNFSTEYIYAISHLLKTGEERLLVAIEKRQIPHSIAMEIVRAKDADLQKALADAYESGSLPGNQVMAIRRIIEQRKLIGKGIHSGGAPSKTGKRKVTADALIRIYRKEADRQKLVVRKATLAQNRLLFIVNALRRLFAEENFATLLRAEGVLSLPKPLAERLDRAGH
jgi:ParB family transcriptional regulator, chromosome partitioning protein